MIECGDVQAIELNHRRIDDLYEKVEDLAIVRREERERSVPCFTGRRALDQFSHRSSIRAARVATR
jgi:hypothetical protein